jgi:flavin-dependent dehydrogenase
MRFTVTGSGPAGSAAAIAGVLEGASVELIEKSRFPRHKVCGEFLSPEIAPLLEQLGVAGVFAAAGPASIRRMSIQFGGREKCAMLPEPAFGLSRFAFDKLLYDRALGAGAGIPSGTGFSLWAVAPGPAEARVIATGRRASAPAQSRGRRLFGFKAHFRGPANDTIELHFFGEGYVGVSAIEGGLTNVCGLAAESALARIGFEYDELLATVPSLAGRVRPLERAMEWLTTGPLIFGNRFSEPADPDVYYAGDALSFVDPFTGSGMYCAVLTGSIAGRNAARGLGSAEHLRQCRDALGRPFAFASLFRNAITSGWAQRVAPFVPAALLYRLTRPKNRPALAS